MANDNINFDASECDSLEATSPRNLNELLAESDENDECLIRIPHSPYIGRNSIANSKFRYSAQSLGAKFNELSLLETELKETDFTLSVTKYCTI